MKTTMTATAQLKQQLHYQAITKPCHTLLLSCGSVEKSTSPQLELRYLVWPPSARNRLATSIPRNLAPAKKTLLVVALSNGALSTLLTLADIIWMADMIAAEVGSSAPTHQARHHARPFVDSVARMRFDAGLLNVLSESPLPRLSHGLNETVASALRRTPKEILDILCGAVQAPTDPGHIYGVRAAAIAILAPVFANDLAPFVHAKVPVAAAANLLWDDDDSEETWTRMLQ